MIQLLLRARRTRRSHRDGHRHLLEKRNRSQVSRYLLVFFESLRYVGLKKSPEEATVVWNF